MKVVSLKEYDFKNGFGMVCRVIDDTYWGRQYEIEVVMTGIPWYEVVDYYKGIDKDESNKKFVELRDRYKAIESGFL